MELVHGHKVFLVHKVLKDQTMVLKVLLAYRVHKVPLKVFRVILA
jgi:hypothetical protein